VGLGDAIASKLYSKYFRVEAIDTHHIPREGPAVLASNHSGTLPLDGMMIWTAVFRNTSPPRIPRAVADYFVPSLPWVGTLFARCGVVGGSRGNARALLEAGELLLIFPEGVPGISKPFKDRYKLQDWRPGHCELAMRNRAPVVPVAVVGAEEQMPQLFRIPIPGPLPHLPVPATLVPLPVKYHIYFGAPMALHEEFGPDAADDPACVARASLRVKAAVQELIDRGLAERQGVFR
jgi:1-acyl-sn-glycerol-3-phosphate acyltransferase